MAPALDAVGTYLASATAASAAVAVPVGTAAGKIVLVHLYKENTAAVTPPAEFTECTNSPVSTSSGVHSQHVFWKRLTGADAGTYTFTWTGSAWCNGVATLYSGCVTSADPTEIDNAAQNSVSGTTIPDTSGTTGGPDRLLVLGTTDINAGIPTVTGFTKQSGGTGSQELAVHTKSQAVAGATGSVSGTYDNAGALTAFLLALVPSSIDAPLPPMRPPGRLAPSGMWAPIIGDTTAAPQVTAAAGAASGTGQAYDAAGSVATAAGNASGTGTGTAPTTSVAASATAAAGTGAAGQPTLSMSAAAGAASGTGAANQPSVSAGGSTNVAAGAGSAYTPITAVSSPAGVASGAGTANTPAPNVAPAASVATGAAAAYSPGATVAATVGHASGTGTAWQPSVGNGSATSATAGHASGVGNAYQPTVTILRGGGGNWGDLRAILATVRGEAATARIMDRLACPNDGEPYRAGAHGELVCPFDGYRPDGAISGGFRRGADWGGLAAATQSVPVPAYQRMGPLDDWRLAPPDDLYRSDYIAAYGRP